jgi:haloalkane dehalogenase
MAIQITRHFATVKGERQVHYRRAGSGPPVVLLHQSPTSSREYIPLITELAEKGYTVFSPDTPGNGMSDPFPGTDWKEMGDFADGVANLMTELGIKKAPVYGFHTGGACALALFLL